MEPISTGAVTGLLFEGDGVWEIVNGFPDKPFTRDTILEQVWGWGFEGTARTVKGATLNSRPGTSSMVRSVPARGRWTRW